MCFSLVKFAYVKGMDITGQGNIWHSLRQERKKMFLLEKLDN